MVYVRLLEELRIHYGHVGESIAALERMAESQPKSRLRSVLGQIAKPAATVSTNTPLPQMVQKTSRCRVSHRA